MPSCSSRKTGINPHLSSRKYCWIQQCLWGIHKLQVCRGGQIRFSLTLFPPLLTESQATSARKLMYVWRFSEGLIYTASVAEHSAYLRYEAYWPRKSLQLKKELTDLLEGSINSFVITVAPQSPNSPAQSPSACWELQNSSTEQWIFLVGFSEFLGLFSYIIVHLKQCVGHCYAFIYHGGLI